MDTASKSKPPEGTPTPSTDSLPSFTEWCEFYATCTPPNLRADQVYPLVYQTMQFLAKRGSPP